MTLTTGQLEGWIAQGESLIAGLPPVATPALIYGYGYFGRELYRVLVAAGVNIIGFVDAHKAGMVAPETGVAILAPDDIPADHLLIQSILNPAIPVATVNEVLRGRCARLLNPLEALWWARSQLLWIVHPGHYRPYLERIVSAWQRICPSDQELYAGVWQDRLCGSFEHLYSIWPDPYFPADLPGLPAELNLIDCGAYDGDVARVALRCGFKLNRLVAFEPDKQNFDRLVSWVSSNRDRLGSAVTLPLATGDSNGILSFSGGLAISSRIAEDGAERVACVRLDDVLASHDANYLKLDVEGAEAATLRGAAGLIRRCQPALAVSVYHRPNDLFELIEQIEEIAPRHRLHLRLHAFAGIDTVLYALPRQTRLVQSITSDCSTKTMSLLEATSDRRAANNLMG